MKNKIVLLLLISLSYFTVKAQLIPAAGQANKAQSVNTIKKANTLKIDSGSINIPMVFVQGGGFIMGDGLNTDNPKHRVTLSSFYMGKYDVTQAQWKAMMGNNPSVHQNCDNCPVEQVSYEDVQTFITKLNQQTGKAYRLPTEAEWEYAAKGGNKSNGYTYSGSNDIDQVAWYNKNSGDTTHTVGQKNPNELGLYDMTGNVNQWCHDWYNANYYKNSPNHNPQGPSTGLSRVDRGGAWGLPALFCRIVDRDFCIPGRHYDYLGFRLVLIR